jgi:hypothetical protein
LTDCRAFAIVHTLGVQKTPSEPLKPKGHLYVEGDFYMEEMTLKTLEALYRWTRVAGAKVLRNHANELTQIILLRRGDYDVGQSFLEDDGYKDRLLHAIEEQGKAFAPSRAPKTTTAAPTKANK